MLQDFPVPVGYRAEYYTGKQDETEGQFPKMSNDNSEIFGYQNRKADAFRFYGVFLQVQQLPRAPARGLFLPYILSGAEKPSRSMHSSMARLASAISAI